MDPLVPLTGTNWVLVADTMAAYLAPTSLATLKLTLEPGLGMPSMVAVKAGKDLNGRGGLDGGQLLMKGAAREKTWSKSSPAAKGRGNPS